MFFVDGVFALAIAFFLTILFVALGRCPRSRRRVGIFFAVVFLGSWAGGVWLGPVGPVVLGVYWLSFFVAGLIFALVQGALATWPGRAARCKRGTGTEADAREEGELESVFNVFMIVLLLLFIAAIVIGYLHRPV